MPQSTNLKKMKTASMSVTTAKTFDALKNRRKKNYANEITGSGNDGNLSLAIKLAYTAPTMSTLPIVVLLAVYMNVYYEKLGASLTYIRYVIRLWNISFFICSSKEKIINIFFIFPSSFSVYFSLIPFFLVYSLH